MYKTIHRGLYNFSNSNNPILQEKSTIKIIYKRCVSIHNIIYMKNNDSTSLKLYVVTHVTERKKTRDMNAKLLKVSRLLPITNERMLWNTRVGKLARRNRKLLRSEKFKRVNIIYVQRSLLFLEIVSL